MTQSGAHDGSRMALNYNVSAILGYLTWGFVADTMGRRRFLFMSFLGSLTISFATYSWHGDMQVFIAIPFLNRLFTQGFAYSSPAIITNQPSIAERTLPTIQETSGIRTESEE